MEDGAVINAERPSRVRFRPALLLLLVPFWALCTANAATYRYGASDQAFYIPAVLLHLHPDSFPRDAPLIRAQAQLTLVDETIGGAAAALGLPLPVLFAALYLVSLTLLAVAGWLIATRLYRSSWTATALVAALTLRHSISRTGTNTLEGYFHPRQLAFGLGALAVAMCLRRKPTGALLVLFVAAAVHPTTAMWFAIWLGVAGVVMEPRSRVPAGVLAILAGLLGTWAVTLGPLAGRLSIMDAAWIATLEEKTYLFPLEWPVATWITNLAYVPIVIAILRWRQRRGLADGAEVGVAVGGLSLALLFAAMLPFNAAHVALAVQLQPARIFWMLDFLATIYVVWAIAEAGATSVRRAQITAVVIVLLSIVRGGYVAFVEFPERPFARLGIADDDWGRAMTWAQSTNARSGWLADPLHAVRYGTSLRAAAGRDVLVEAVKDAAVGMYDRDVAMRTKERLEAVGDFAALTPERARSLAATYDLDYLITEHPLDLPLAFESGALHVYRLR